MVLRHYKNYDKSYIYPNEHYVCWQTYLNNRKLYNFNSFIMGNSCTMGFHCFDWEKYLDKKDKAFRLFGNSESLLNVDKKLHALERFHAPIRHILLIADDHLLADEVENYGVYTVLPPDISDIGEFNFQMIFLQSFFSPKYLFPYCEYNISHHFSLSMKAIINHYGRIRNPLNCDAINPHEKEIRQEGFNYWKIHQQEFPPHNGTLEEHKSVISKKEIVILNDIKTLCLRNHADIKVVISPAYIEKKLNYKDLSILQHIYGKQNVFDFSGRNSYSQNIHNFYDQVHFRPELGMQLLNRIYNKKP